MAAIDRNAGRREAPRLSVPCAALAACALLVAGCGRDRAGDAAAPPKAPSVVTILSTIDTSGVNELVSADVQFTTDVLDQLFVNLLAESPDFTDHPPTFEPDLATAWIWSDDRKSLTFTLRPDAVWSDGQPITADDVRFTWLAQTSPEVAWSYAHLKESITDVEVVDSRTVRFHVSEEYPGLLADVVDGKILPKHAWEKLPFAKWRGSADWFREHLVTSGPFRLAEWLPGERIVLERNDRFWDRARPKLDRVVFRVAPEASTHASLVAAAAADVACGLTPTDARSLEKAPGVRLVPYAGRQYDYLCWNTGRAPFGDRDVRRAMTLAIDRRALVDTLWAGYAPISVGPVPSNFWAFDHDLAPWPYDPAEARRILAAKGFADRDGDGILERDGKPFSFELTTNSSNRARSDSLVLIQAQLRQVGVDARPRTMELHTLTEKNIAHDFDATVAGWAVDTTVDIKPYFHSAEANGGYNFGSWKNAEADRLLDAARRAATPELALPDLLEFQRLAHREQPYTFLWEPPRLCAVRDRIADFRPNAFSAYANLSDWSIASSPDAPVAPAARP